MKVHQLLMLGAILSWSFFPNICLSGTYIVTQLHPATGYTYSLGRSNSEDTEVGFGITPMPINASHAMLWHGTAQSFVDLNPAGYAHSEATAVSSSTQVGWGSKLSNGGDGVHALLWHGTAASFVDLHTPTYLDDYAFGVYGDTQVGRGFVTGSGEHALLWHGTAASVADLNPTQLVGATSSEADGVWGDTQIGYAVINSNHHAVVWNGTAASAVDIHPSGFTSSEANAIWENQIIGTGKGPTTGNKSHALLWNDTSGNALDLNPAGFDQTFGNSVASGMQVGSGSGPITNNQGHALVWNGTADSVVDLHAILTQVDPTFTGSTASGINSNGEIVGYASRGPIFYAVTWSPIPEPSGILLLGLGAISVLAYRKRTRS